MCAIDGARVTPSVVLANDATEGATMPTLAIVNQSLDTTIARARELQARIERDSAELDSLKCELRACAIARGLGPENTPIKFGPSPGSVVVSHVQPKIGLAPHVDMGVARASLPAWLGPRLIVPVSTYGWTDGAGDILLGYPEGVRERLAQWVVLRPQDPRVTVPR